MGRIVAVFGLRGELKIHPSRIGEDALRNDLTVTLRFEGEGPPRPATIRHVRRAKGTFVATLDGIETLEAAEELIGADVVVPRASIELGKGEYFDDDLIGCRLMEGERCVGNVRAVRHYPAQDMLEIEGGVLVPMVGAFVREIDLALRIIRVELPPGLVEGEPESA